MNKHKAFLIEMPDPEDKEGMAAFYDLMNGIQDATIEYIKKLAKELDVSEDCASDVYYLRTRSRHTYRCGTARARFRSSHPCV